MEMFIFAYPFIVIGVYCSLVTYYDICRLYLHTYIQYIYIYIYIYIYTIHIYIYIYIYIERE